MAARSHHHPLGPAHIWTNRLKRLVFGAPKRTDQQHHERLGVMTGLAVFSSDALSSVAYATEQILLVLAGVGTIASVYSLSAGLAIIALIFIVAASYTQTIHAYPNGGGSYIVSSDNLGRNAGLVAGAALLIDYVLTVAVSTASGIAAITSAVPFLQGHEVVLCLFAIWFIAWINLRGVKESGNIFSLPIYGFILTTLLMIGVGIFKAATGTWHPVAPVAAGFGMGSPEFKALTSGVTLFIWLKAFSSGCTALTGIEAVSNGVQAFKHPEDVNAIKVLRLARTLLFVMFAGITVLAYGFRLMPVANQTLLSQMAHITFGNSVFYYFFQVMTMLILLLAANTSYQDFPRLSSLIAKDGFMPRKLANRGDTLVFNVGVYVLAGLASVLIVAFKGSVDLLIPLYAVGVFLAFTMSQTGMVVHWVKLARKLAQPLRRHGWSIFINGLGAVLSAVALVVIAVTKFAHGAWIVTIAIPLLVLYFRSVHSYYERFTARVESLQGTHMTFDDANAVKVVLTIGGLSPVIDHSLQVARQFSSDITAVFVATEPELGEKMARKWDINRHKGVPLVVLDSPYRNVVPPLRKYLTTLHQENPNTVINLLVPVVVTNDPFDSYLHNGLADRLLREMRFSEGILMTVIPFYVDMDPAADHVIATYPPLGDD
ncbi:MAG: APC family permease [Mycobacterium leprae]